MSITTAQIRGARGILNWSQQDLSQRTGISATSIGSIENGQTTPRASTLETIRKTLENGGIEFVGMEGVKQKDYTLTIIQKSDPSDNVYLRLMDDIYYTIKEFGSTEILFSFIDQSLSPAEIIKRQQDIRDLGTKMRFIVKHGDQNLRFPASEYCHLPDREFITNPCVIYGDKYAVMVRNSERVIVIKDLNLAEIQRTQFDLIWNYAKKSEVV